MTVFAELLAAGDPTVPDLSPGVTSLLASLASADCDIGDIAKELELHPVIGARMIALANSAWSAPDGTIVDLTSACVRLGMSVVKSSAIAYAVAAPFDPLRCQGFDSVRFWTCALLGAETSAQIAGYRNLDESIARTGGLLRNLGLVWLADAMPQQTSEALNLLANDPQLSTADALTGCVGVSHLQATYELMAAWGMPEQLLCLYGEADGNDISQVCSLSSRVVNLAYSDAEQALHPLEQSGLSESEIASVGTQVAQSIERYRTIAQTIAS